MEILKKTSFWFFVTAIVYCVAMLIFISLKTFLFESAEMISAFGSILGALAAFFAAFTALYVFNGWRVTEDHRTQNTHINSAVNSFFNLQNSLKSTLDQTIEISNLCSQQILDFKDRTQILIITSKIQTEISFFLREFKIHLQMFSTISNTISLCEEYERVIDDLENAISKKYGFLIEATRDKTPSEISDAYKIYSAYIAGDLVVHLHNKIILDITKRSKATD
ncbi:hypothetical protein MWMV17_MWMV17_00648 [Acinetobacter calcoaceticus]|uniref:Uncharacterized protein n=1 Tax=Acinetobacter calcoaceticus DSM 30006 = CIP 81.8 TaxID=981331 RepID=A0ABP2UHP6_ACICA|nr:hypothetical protein [Acinetobacter calcoaceticus]ENV98972.1 hypothetical protein F936_02055 [Acinetobacter calcoaceticus DSM 30006 = CIP 81.8]CAI3110856.1 hypothetical protein MWMV17_MWMV17_00648 [Acinetobacter calcoaceticus]SUU55841.1 Uncharacterised protein [Acinetobacter calcoaceticus]